MNNTGLGALVSTTKQVSGNAHSALRLAPPLVLARGAFLGLLRLNVWGLAKLLSKKAFLVDAATTDAQPNGKNGGIFKLNLEMVGLILEAIGINLFQQ
jgi:hypothetical protein